MEEKMFNSATGPEGCSWANLIGKSQNKTPQFPRKKKKGHHQFLGKFTTKKSDERNS